MEERSSATAAAKAYCGSLRLDVTVDPPIGSRAILQDRYGYTRLQVELEHSASSTNRYVQLAARRRGYCFDGVDDLASRSAHGTEMTRAK